MTELMQGFNNPEEEPEDYSKWLEGILLILALIIFINIIKQCTP